MSYRSTVHYPDFHRNAPVKEPCRVATTANVTISTALNNGDTIDGVTLATNDRVLVWKQTNAEQNGIYVVGTSPARAYDMDDAGEVPGCLLAVLTGDTYAGSIFHNTNTGNVILDTTGITFEVVGEPSGTFVTTTDGGGEVIKSHGSMGSTETIDLADGNYHYGTLNANCNLTFASVSSGALRTFTLELAEDSTGGYSPTWPGSVVWPGGATPTHDTTASSVSFYVFFTRDGGTTWYGFPVGGGSSDSMWVPVTVYEPSISNYLVAVDGSGNAIMVEVPLG